MFPHHKLLLCNGEMNTNGARLIANVSNSWQLFFIESGAKFWQQWWIIRDTEWNIDFSHQSNIIMYVTSRKNFIATFEQKSLV